MKKIVPGVFIFLCVSLVCGFSTAVAYTSDEKWEVLDPVLAYSIDEVDWSLETVNSLEAGGINYIGSLALKTERELPPDLTLKSLTEIKDWLAERSLSLGMKILWPSNKTEEEELVRKLRLNFTEGKNPVFARPIDSMPWTIRTKNALTAEDIYYIGALVQMTEEELGKIPNLGEKSLTEVKRWLTPRGLKPGINTHWPSDPQEEKKLLNRLNPPDSLDELPENIKLILAQRIDRLDWAVQTKRILKYEGIYYIGALVQMTREELIRVPNFGRKNINEITDWLTPRGLWLEINIPWPSDPQEEKELANKLNPPDSLEELLKNVKWILAQRIDDLDWSGRIKNAFHFDKIYYIGALVQMTEEELRKIPNLGEKSLTEVTEWLTSRGLRLGMNINWPSDKTEEAELVNKITTSWPSDSQRESEGVKKLYPIEEWEGVGNGILTSREEQVLKMRFGTKENHRTFKEIGEIFNVTPERIRQIQAKILWKFYNRSIDPDILYYVGVKIYEGEGIKRDPHRAALFWKKASDQGHAEAQYRLGYLYSKGEGVKKDPEQATQLWEQAAAQGHQEAQRSLDEQEQCSPSHFRN